MYETVKSQARKATEELVEIAKLDYKAQKQHDAEVRKLKNRIEAIEKEIEVTETAIAELEEQLMLPENATDYEKSIEISKNIEENKNKLEELYAEWEDNSTRLANM